MRALSLAALLAVSGCTAAHAGAGGPGYEVAALMTAARPSSVFGNTYPVILNGELTRLGVLASTGTTINNTTTGTTFTITATDCPSRVLMFDCNGAGNIGNGATCSDDITSANYKPQTGAHEWRYFTLDAAGATSTVCLDTAAITVSCAVFCMK